MAGHCSVCGRGETLAEEAARLGQELPHAGRGRRAWIVYRLAELKVHTEGFTEASIAAYSAASDTFWKGEGR